MGASPSWECLLVLALSSGGRVRGRSVLAAGLSRFKHSPFAPAGGPLRSAPRTESGGEFDWGGTSVK